jgi:hypothetical protein
MLYQLNHNPQGLSIEPVALKDFSHFGPLEQTLQDAIARNMLDVLFEGSGLLPIFQPRTCQAEIKAVGTEQLYRDVEFITARPKQGERIPAMPFSRVTECTGKNFFWARTMKVPFLRKDEADRLLLALKKYLQN